MSEAPIETNADPLEGQELLFSDLGGDGAPPDASTNTQPIGDATPPPRPKKKRNKKRPTVDEGKGAAPPFQGGPPSDDRPAPSVEPEPAKKAMQVAVDPKIAADTLIDAVDPMIMAFYEGRYGKEATAMLGPQKAQKDNLRDALVLFMQSAALQVSPAANLGIAAAMCYAFPALALEMARRQQFKGAA